MPSHKFKVLKEITEALDKAVDESNNRILAAVDRYTNYGETKRMSENWIYRTEVGEEDGPLEQLGWITGVSHREGALTTIAKLLKVNEPLLTVLDHWTDNRKVYYAEWVKILMDAAYEAGRAAEAKRIKEHIGEVPE